MNDGLILGIDGSRVSTGYALLRLDGTRVTSGAWVLATPPKRGRKTMPDEAGTPPGESWALLRCRLDRLDEEHAQHIEVLAFENVGGGQGMYSVDSIMGAQAIVQCWAHRKVIAARPVNTRTAKALATGKGNADKPAMIAAARKRWGKDCITSTAKRQIEDEADALWIAAACLEEMTNG